MEKLTHSFRIEASKHRLVGCLYLPEGGLLVPLHVNSASHLGEKWFLEIFFRGYFNGVGAEPGDPHAQRKAKPHGQVLLCRRTLVKLSM